jgi:type II secretory pathway pseudopilin PulG
MSMMKLDFVARRRLRAFSMPELLICLGTVTILVSLAIPAIAAAKARASTGVALSNARQLATLIQQYAADWRDLPPCVFAPIYSRYSEGPWQTATLNGRDLRAGSWFGNAIYYHHLLGSDETIRRIAFAPSRPADKRSDSPTNWSSDFSLAETTFATPEYWNRRTQQGAAQFQLQRLSDVVFPSQKGLVHQNAVYTLPDWPQGRGSCCDERVPVPVIWSDLSGSIEIKADLLPGEPNFFHHGVAVPLPLWADGFPIDGTLHGVRGRDRQ